MRTLTYWVAECLNDSTAYNIRGRRRKDVVADLELHGDKNDYGPIKKVFIEYRSAFDLVVECLSEGRGYWEC